MDRPHHVSELTKWYCRLVNEPGFREYTLDRVKLMAERQRMYRPLFEAVKQASLNPQEQTNEDADRP